MDKIPATAVCGKNGNFPSSSTVKWWIGEADDKQKDWRNRALCWYFLCFTWFPDPLVIGEVYVFSFATY